MDRSAHICFHLLASLCSSTGRLKMNGGGGGDVLHWGWDLDTLRSSMQLDCEICYSLLMSNGYMQWSLDVKADHLP